MPTVRKVGLVDDILPSLDELQAIQRIKATASKIIRTSTWDRITGDPDWKNLRSEWNKVKYYRKSRTLGRSLYNVQNNAIYNTPSPQVLERYYTEIMLNVWGSQFDMPEQLLADLQQVIQLSESEPVKLSILGSDGDWIFKGYHYSTEGPYSDDQFRLLILEEFDKERKRFEKLKRTYESTEERSDSYSRPRILESVRIEVWRRDGGKCARCGSRERLEYDHIIPISKGGSNTARNIELLCESCNRSKSDKIQ